MDLSTITPQGIRQVLSGSVRRTLPLPVGFQRAAVLVPIEFRSAGPELLFTRRTETVETHKGQVSFPGGAVDKEDAGPVQTALREMEEEVGIDAQWVDVLGLLDDMETPTGFVITPVVGELRSGASILPNASEVAEVFRVPLGFFDDPRNGRKEFRMVRGIAREVWHYEAGAHTIWGATAAIVRSLIITVRASPEK